MSEFQIKVVKIGKIEKHPNADTLSITHIYDYPCIIRTGDFAEGDKAVYIPVDSVVPENDPQFAFLDGHTRIKAKKLRGTFSMGLLVHAKPEWIEGQDICEEMRIVKYEPLSLVTKYGDNERDPGYMVYYDIEGLRRYPDVLVEGEEVVISEKIHGANSRFVYTDDRFYCASHHCYKKNDEKSLWWIIARQYDLENKLKKHPGVGLYAEVYGYVQSLRYGLSRNDPYRLIAFDALDTRTKRYLDYDDFVAFAKDIDVPIVPVLYRGRWKKELREHAEGKSVIEGADHVREGIVIKPVKERWDDEIGRVILKIHGEGCLLNKGRKAR